MGNLFTRALKRLTQGGSGNQLPSHEQQDAGTSQQRQQQEQQSRPTVQSIPVGQSIDSAEYAAFEPAKSSLEQASAEAARVSEQESRRATVKTPIEEVDEEEEDQENEQQQQQQQQQPELAAEEQNKPEMEEAVIKIQAFVRGHLTRKALKDAQQHAATPPPNALGQSQFDQESLMKSPPSAIFGALSAPPAGAPADLLGDQINRLASSPGSSRVPPLESIAEDVELSGGRPASRAGAPSDQVQQNERRKLATMSRSLAISSDGRCESVSPAASETNASIELNCDTPPSASIDILDHNIRPADALASVLHPKPAAEAPLESEATRGAGSSPRMVVEPPRAPAPASHQRADNGTQSNSQAPQQTLHQSSSTPSVQNSHSIDSAEAAAIRIQSAYRGYHTRKHSPYRRRSPNGGAGGLASSSPPSLDSGLSNGQAARRSPLRQQNATVALDDLIDEEQLEPAAISGAAGQEQPLARLQEVAARRASRPRHRLDTDDSQREGDSTAALEGTTSTTIEDEPSNDTCVSMVAMDSANISRQAGNLTRADDSSPAPHSNGDVKLSIDQNLSLEMDTESSNLGAALSMNEDLSERDASASIRQLGPSPDERASEVQRFVDQLVNDEEDEEEAEAEAEAEKTREQEEELERVTDQLEAALEEATEEEEEGRDRMAESLANAILDEDEQRTIELESDDIERRDPRGQRSQDRPISPAIRTQDSQPALVSGGSLDEEQQQQEVAQEQQQQRLGVESPDEAIGSGRSSPALVSSNAASSDEEGEGEENEEEAETKAAAEGQTGDKQAQSQQAGPTANKSRKKSRNRKKGRK